MRACGVSPFSASTVSACRALSLRRPERSRRHHRCLAGIAKETVEDLDTKYDWVARYQTELRSVPIAVGVLGFVALLLNRTISGVAPVVDASSSQSRVDILVVAMAASLALTGFQWLTLAPITPTQVEPTGKKMYFVRDRLKTATIQEVGWVWDALSASTRCRSLVIVHSGQTVLQAGLAAPRAKEGRTPLGTICTDVMTSGRANYLANLTLFPGRVEFESYLPADMSAVIIAPIGNSGVLIAGSDTQRGFGRLDQAWISSIADKLEDSLELDAPGGVGFKAA